MISQYYNEFSFSSKLIKIKKTNLFVTKALIHKKNVKKFDVDGKKLCSPEMAMELAKKHGKTLTLIINLDFDFYTNYENEFKKFNIRCKKIGNHPKHGLVNPSFGSLKYFCNFLYKNDLSMKPNEAILIHSNLGLDRVACFLCCYWMLSESISATQAVDLFVKSRGHKLLNPNMVINFLFDVHSQIPKLLNQIRSYEAPNGWLDYSKMGDLVENSKFIAMKTPLSTMWYKNVPNHETFYCKDAIQMAQEKGFRVGMVLSLSNTDRHYERHDFIESGIFFEKIKVPGQIIPSDWIIKMFCSKVAKFEEKNKENNSIILVHCTHGLNRTGFLVCNYLIRNKGFTATKAVDCFEKARGHKISREAYIDELLCYPKTSSSQDDSCKILSEENHSCFKDNSSQNNPSDRLQKLISCTKLRVTNSYENTATAISNTSNVIEDIESYQNKISLPNFKNFQNNKCLENNFLQTNNNETKKDQSTCEIKCSTDSNKLQSYSDEVKGQQNDDTLIKRSSSINCPINNKMIKIDSPK